MNAGEGPFQHVIAGQAANVKQMGDRQHSPADFHFLAVRLLLDEAQTPAPAESSRARVDFVAMLRDSIVTEYT